MRQRGHLGPYLLLSAGLLAGCGGGLLRLPDSALLGLPAEGRRWVFDAENAVVVALDGVDVAGEGLREAETQVARADKGLKVAQTKNQAGGDRQGAELGVQAAQAQLAAANGQRELAEEQIRLAREKVKKARADLELDKARLVTTYDLVAVRGFSLQPYEAQVQDTARRVESAQKQTDALAHKLQEQQEQTQNARQRYIAKTGDFDSGVWLD